MSDTGLEKVLSNLNKEISKIKNHTLAGLIEGVRIVRYDMDKTPPLIPVDTGNLRASWFTVTSRGGVEQGQAPGFKGKKAEEMAEHHSKVVTQVQATAKSVGSPTVICGFSANYALEVHEKYGVNFQRPGAGAGFFKASLERNSKAILDAIKEAAKI